MLQSERINDQQEALRAILKGWQANLWTALPGIVQSYDATKGTCVIQPSIQAIVTSSDGTKSNVSLPPLPDVPVVYMGGGGFVATFPIQQGDEALVVFSSRCIDAWWQSGGVQAQAEQRMHDLSDGFALIGPRSQANLIPSVSTTTAQLRSLDGSTYYELAAGQIANIVAPGGINITGPVAIDGDVSITGTTTADGDVSITGKATATGEVQGNGIKLSTHTHSGVTTGGGTSGPPVP
jgi:phage baseplate assembly protein gpV